MSGNVNLKRYKSIGLDTNVFIYQFDKHPRFGPKTKRVFNLLANNKLRAVTNFITLTELLSVKATPKKIEGLKNLFLNTPNLKIFEVDLAISLESARLRRKYAFRLPDSIQLATALYSKAQAFLTNDQGLKRFKELPVLLLDNMKI